MSPARCRKLTTPKGGCSWGLLSREPTKFGKLILAMRKDVSELEAIEHVYGWNEKELNKPLASLRHGAGKRVDWQGQAAMMR